MLPAIQTRLAAGQPLRKSAPHPQNYAVLRPRQQMYQGRTVAEVVTGKPIASGGTLGRREATGRGVAHLIVRSLECIKRSPRKASAIVQGFGNVGGITAAALEERGSMIVGVSDHTGAFYNPKGFRCSDLEAHLKTHGVLRGFASECAIDPEDLLIQPCDILVP